MQTVGKINSAQFGYFGKFDFSKRKAVFLWARK
jgi:hypothetical protein